MSDYFNWMIRRWQLLQKDEKQVTFLPWKGRSQRPKLSSSCLVSLLVIGSCVMSHEIVPNPFVPVDGRKGTGGGRIPVHTGMMCCSLRTRATPPISLGTPAPRFKSSLRHPRDGRGIKSRTTTIQILFHRPRSCCLLRFFSSKYRHHQILNIIYY